MDCSARMMDSRELHFFDFSFFCFHLSLFDFTTQHRSLVANFARERKNLIFFRCVSLRQEESVRKKFVQLFLLRIYSLSTCVSFIHEKKRSSFSFTRWSWGWVKKMEKLIHESKSNKVQSSPWMCVLEFDSLPSLSFRLVLRRFHTTQSWMEGRTRRHQATTSWARQGERRFESRKRNWKKKWKHSAMSFVLWLKVANVKRN